MEFFTSAVTTMQTIVFALGAVFVVIGGLNWLDGYSSDSPGAKNTGLKQLVAGGGIILIGITLVPKLAGVFG
ncbi:MAG: conjugative transfer protein [Lachnospiraceae bacterium]|nr:conjugative transfer protein [Lachnospiraceae bacterium]